MTTFRGIFKFYYPSLNCCFYERAVIFRLGRLDVLPSGDLGVQEGLRLLDDMRRRPTPQELAERGKRWAPLRSVATWYMYRLVDESRDGDKGS